ncbi:PREDICTED: uncharacterized protein LOC106149630 [Chinchilla lanigera]|uniref:uncharacterized protein LOC106149630 n=1 Tax=Chinchilla lanigera TaxID=34839 RepID=UPI0006976C13|nr:PREDICTED: uncharacterized protein LOC106149630 [Chinchilla lanigera]
MDWTGRGGAGPVGSLRCGGWRDVPGAATSLCGSGGARIGAIGDRSPRAAGWKEGCAHLPAHRAPKNGWRSLGVFARTRPLFCLGRGLFSCLSIPTHPDPSWDWLLIKAREIVSGDNNQTPLAVISKKPFPLQAAFWGSRLPNKECVTRRVRVQLLTSAGSFYALLPALPLRPALASGQADGRRMPPGHLREGDPQTLSCLNPQPNQANLLFWVSEAIRDRHQKPQFCE